MDGEKTVYFPVDEEKAVSFPVDEVKEVCSPVDEIMYFPFPINGGGEEIAVSPRSRDDMTVFEIRGFTSCVYNGRLLPELLWWVFSSFPPYSLSIAFNYFMPIPIHMVVIFCVANLFYITLQAIVLLYPLLNNYWYPYKTQFRSMGPKGKFMIDFIPALTAAALSFNLLNDADDKGLWHFLEFNYGYIFLLFGCTGYFYLISHFMRRAYDISGKDVMLGLAMQVFCFMVKGKLFVRVIALCFCFGISIYRYMTYSAPPALPPRPKMESSDMLSY
ncbi:uncharacterized protein [Solanum tuberosum]|uniref:uncharacterized protein isoform X1 n=1 Tax=Solanum tuberosum TaxID=4113 RepID=UPI00073A4316|nr:PREDICTED: uncharacterized protein LOC102603825 isoform X1 [Solanum tuberosum]